MGIVINKGMEFKRNGRLYQITSILEPNRYEARHIGNDLDVLTLTSIDINHLVDRGDVEFLAKDIGGKVIPFRDLSGLPKAERKEALRRFKYVKTALEYTRYERSTDRMQKAIEDAAQKLSEIVVNNGDKPPRGKKARKKQRKAPSVRTLYRWVNAFIASGKNVRSLITNRRKQERKSSLDPDVVQIIDERIKNYYLRSPSTTVRRLHGEIIIKVDDHNRSIPANKVDKPLTSPHINTIYNHLNKLDEYEVDKERYGKAYAEHKFRVIRKGEEPTRPMEVAQMDHTILDLFIVDAKTRWPLGRPCLTTMMDQKTRTICGFHVGFDPPSFLSDMCCLYNALKSKAYVAKKYPSIHNPWLNHGLCERLLVDNGKDFVSNHFKNVASHMGFTITYAPPREPWKKGRIERAFGTMNTGFINSFPGAVYTEIMDELDLHKSGYNPQKDAILDLDDFIEALHKWIIDIYHQDYHRGLKGVPQKAWEAATKECSLILVPSAHDLRVVLGMTFTRFIQNRGIEFEGLFYNSRDLPLMREKYEDVGLTIKVDPTDLSMIHIHDEALDIYLPVPAVEEKLTRGVSLWQHQVVKRRAREKYHEVSQLTLAKSRRELDQIVKRAWGKSNISSRVKSSRYKGYRQDHSDSHAEFTAEDQTRYMPDEELVNSGSSSQPIDFVASRQPVSNSGEMPIDYMEDHEDAFSSDYDDDGTYDDDEELDSYGTNYDPAA